MSENTPAERGRDELRDAIASALYNEFRIGKMPDYRPMWHEVEEATRAKYRALANGLLEPFAALLAQQEALVAALRAIVDMEPEPFDFPADWSQQVAACEECKRWRNHPIQLGICDTHRQAFWDRDAHEKSEQLRLHYRMRSVAREALDAYALAAAPAEATERSES